MPFFQSSRRSPLSSLISRLSVRTTDPDADPRFKVLVTGLSGSGKLSLIDAIFETSFRGVIHGSGTAETDRDITSQYNEHLVIHYSHDVQGGVGKEGILKKLHVGRNQKKPTAERFHAVWLCIATPSLDDPSIASDNLILKTIQNKVPTIVVFTKFDVFISRLGEQAMKNAGSIQEFAEKEFKKRYGHVLDSSTDIPHSFVAVSQPETLQRLVDVTMQSIFNCTSRSNQQTTLGKDILYPAQIALATAQRVDAQAKIAASIKVGENAWSTIASGGGFSNVMLEDHISLIHKDIVTVWNIRDLSKDLHGDEFRSRIMFIVESSKRSEITTSIMEQDLIVASGVGGVRAKDVYQDPSEYMRCVMVYLVDITLILQKIFQRSLHNRFKEELTPTDIDEIIYEFVCSEQMEQIHNRIAIITEDQHPAASSKIMEEVKSLIKHNAITKNGMQPSQTRPLSSLLAILRVESSSSNAINRITLDFMRKLLDPPDYLSIVSQLGTADVALLLDFIVCLLRDGRLKNHGIQGANGKARRLLDKLSRMGVLPKTLFITHVETHLSTIGVGGFGSVFKGEYEKEPVALKVLYKARGIEGSVGKDFCREALTWLSLSHEFVLPIKGIYEQDAHLFLVSPYMTNGSLSQWRKSYWPGEIEIRRVMLEVARGVEYIHSEGIVHGDLSAADVLLDSEFHCRITDFGLTQHVESTLSPTAMAVSINYAAPELVGMCSECGQSDCTGCLGQKRGKTMQTDVYAFGCLYYTVFFGTMPFQGESLYRIIPLILNGQRAKRLNDPRMDDNTWKLLERCWCQNPSQRPTMENIVAGHSPNPESLLAALLTDLKKAIGGSMVNADTVNRMCEMLDQSELDSITSQVVTTSDVELLLDFILRLFRNDNLANAGTRRKARKLMIKLISSTSIIPESILITDIKIWPRLGAIGVGAFGRIFRGESNTEQVMLKVIDKSRKNGSLRQDFCREAIAWRSLSHRFILPLRGIFEEKSQQYLVSPFMINGTLGEWRRKQTPTVADETDIHRLMLEVAEGLRYIHSEGVVHGDLHGENVLLDSNHHCQITGFGFARQAETAVTRSTTTFLLSFAAPELFGLCTKCSQLECTECYEGTEPPHRRKTMETDVYAFGCLYYATFFGTVPFREAGGLQIIQLVTSGKRPDRLQSPMMENNTWELIQDCWEFSPSKRSTMEQIVTRLTSFARLTDWQNDPRTYSMMMPELGTVGDLLTAIITLCNDPPHNKNTARSMAESCRGLCKTLILQRTVQHRDNVFRCLTQIKGTMEKLSQKSWLNFEAELNDCNERISDCLTGFTGFTEHAVHQNEDNEWKRKIKESLDADDRDAIQFSAVDFKQRIMDSKLKDEITMMQKGLSGNKTVSEEEHTRMAKNLYSLLQPLNQLPPDCCLDGMVKLSGEATSSNKNAEMYKGRYLHSQDVRIKILRSANPKDETSMHRIKREIELWAKVHEKDQGKHVVPFYGFFSPDGLRLALVSPWMANGDALEYVKRNMPINYKGLIVGIAEGMRVLHCTDPPIIHGNLRAENVLIGDEGQPLITDFGLAKLEGNLLTQSSGLSDTCRWTAPEMFEEEATLSSKSDIYSFGMTTLQLLTQDKPYANVKTVFQVFNKKLRGEIPSRPQDPSVIKRGLDDAMWMFLCLCWSKNPEDRPSMEEIIMQL